MIHAAHALAALLAAAGPLPAPPSAPAPTLAAPQAIPTLIADEPAPGVAALPSFSGPQHFGPHVPGPSFPGMQPQSGGAGGYGVESEPEPYFSHHAPAPAPPPRSDRICSEVGPPYHYDRVFQPPPLGRSMHATMDAQVRNGEAALDVLHRSDFLRGEAELSPYGLRRLASIAGRLPTHARPVVIEPPASWEPDGPALAAARQARVAELLAGGSFPVPPERVVIAADPAQGLGGTDAELIYRNLLILTGSGGKLRTRFDVFGNAAQSATAPASAGSAAAGTQR